jgi:hypothetical protein
MATSINGWSVLSPSSDLLVTKKIPGVHRSLTMRKGVLPLFLALGAEYDRRIAKLDQGTLDDWSYAYRQANMANAWSDHASGTAVDFNATKEGAQGPGEYDWWRGEKSKIARELLAKYEILIWGGPTSLGGEYSEPQNWDFMHWALKPGTNMTDVKRVKAKLGIRNDGTIDLPVIDASILELTVRKHKQAPNVSLVARAMKKVGLDGFAGGDSWGAKKQAAYKKWQKQQGVTPTGYPDFISLRALGNQSGLFKVVK